MAKQLEGMIKEVGNDILNDQRVAENSDLVRKSYDALSALVALHNSFDPQEQIVWE